MERIFVSVASYRDKECPKTISSIFKNAKNPERIYVGICQQNKENDMRCISFTDPNIQQYMNNIRLNSIPYTEAKGPTYARYLCSKLWNGEEYYFQIDSHTRLIKNWDEKLINMNKILSKRNKKNVISHYPPSVDDYDKNTINSNVTAICTAFFNERGMISFGGAEHIKTKNELKENAFIAAGMFFCSSEFLKDIPYDPNLDYLFVGEEILHSIRFWTNGWDIYTPSENIAFHYYTRADEPKIWTDKKYSDEDAFNKVKEIIGLINTNKNHEYGLGNERSLDDYYKFAGIDINNKTVNKNFCREEKTDNNKTIISSITLIIIITIMSVLVYIYLKNKKFKH